MTANLPDHLRALEAGVRDAAEMVGDHFFRNAEVFTLHSQAIGPGAP